jgi:hypothetical protein
MEIIDLREVQRLQPHKYNLVVCELFNRNIHGFCKDSDAFVNGHYLCMHISRNRSIFEDRVYDSEDDEFNIDYDSEECHIGDLVDLRGAYYINYTRHVNIIRKHNLIRNYHKIIYSENYIQPHIGEVVYLSSGECVCIIKTFWLRLVQRCWRRVYNEKKRVIQRRKNIQSLRFREIHGKWPNDCNYLPGLNGMILHR